MACNCGTQEQIEAIINRYGPHAPKDKNKPLKQRIKDYTKYLAAVFVMLFIAPVVFLYVAYVAFFAKEKKISLTKFFNLKKDNVETSIG